MSPLKFETLRQANKARVGKFRNKHGGLAHSRTDGSDWSPAQWLQAMVGELGEFANLRKKFERGDIGLIDYAREAQKELADIQIYLDLLAMRALDFQGSDGNKFVHPTGIDLGQAVLEKFNEVSDRVGVDIKLRQRKLFTMKSHEIVDVVDKTDYQQRMRDKASDVMQEAVRKNVEERKEA